jgi:uncharacterized protein (TIGR00369 family)
MQNAPSAADQARVFERMRSIPIYDTLGFRDVAFHDGVASAVVPRRPEYDGILHTFHGGLLMTVADSVAGLAALMALGPDVRIATSHMSITLLRPATGDVRAEARLLRRGRRVVPCVVDLFDGDRHVAFAEVTYAVLDPEGSATGS